MMNPKPIGLRRTVQLMVILTILAWATQTLFKQWGYGAIILPAKPTANYKQAGAVRLELRAGMTTDDPEVTLRQVCRWDEADEEAMEPYADVVLVRLNDSLPARQIALSDVRDALHDAGAKLSQLRFTGAATCSVRRSDVSDELFDVLMNEQAAAAGATTRPSYAGEEIVADADQTTLRELLLVDLCERVNLPADRVQVSFDDRDLPTLILTAPRCRFEIDANQAQKLGNVTWDVTIRTDTSERRATMTAKALAYEDQVVMTRSLSKGQTIIPSDVQARRVLVDTVREKVVTDPSAILGQQLARNVKRGDALADGDVVPASIVTKGQFVTVAMTRGDMIVETVARAIDTGGRGQVVRVQNEANGEVYTMIVTAPGQGEVKQITSDSLDIANTDQQPMFDR